MNKTLNKNIIIFLGICILWLLGLPLLFSRVVPIICENITYNYKFNINVENPRLYLNIIPTAIIKADRISVSLKDENDNIDISDFKLKIRLLPLLSGKVHIDAIEASDVQANAIIEKNEYLDKDFVTRLLNTKTACDKLKFDKLNIKIKESSVSKPVIYEGSNILYVKNGRYLKLNMQGNVKLEDKLSVINVNLYLPKNNSVKDSDIDIVLSNFDIAPLGDYLKNYLPNDTEAVRGIIDLDATKEHLNVVIKNGAYIRKDEAKSIVFPEELKINSGFNLTRKDILIDNAEIKSKNLDAVVNGVVSNYLGKLKPEVNIEVRINHSKIEEFINMLPPFETEDIDTYKLKKYKFYGDVLGNISIKGDIIEPLINGSIFINNGILTKPIPNAQGATVKLDFKGKYLDFDVLVPAGAAQKVMVKGGVELYNIKYSDMRVWSTPHVDLATAEEKVVPIHEILNFVIGPVPIMDIKGDGNIDITIKGNRKNPHVWGSLNFYNTHTYFKEIPDMVLDKAVAVLKFDDENAEFNLKKGVVDGTNINIDGTCNLSGKFDFDVKTEKQKLAYLYKSIKTSTMIDEVKDIIPEIEDIQGLSNLKLKVYGNIKDIEDIKFNKNFFVKGVIELLDNSMKSQGVKIHNTKGTINFENTSADFDVTSAIGQSPLVAKGSIKDNHADADVYIPKLNLHDIVESSDKFQQENSNIIVEVAAKYCGRIDNIEYDKIDFEAKILDVTKNNKLKLSNGIISLKNSKLILKDINGNFVDTKSSFRINLQADNVTSKPLLNGKILLKDFELRLLNTFSDYMLIPKDIRDVMKTVRFEKGKVNISANIFRNNITASTDIGGIAFTYTPLSLPIQVVNGSVYIKRNYLGLNKINMMADDLPILLDGGVHNIFTKQDFDIYMNTKPKQGFVDKYYNTYKLYPIKIKGDIVSWARLKGTKDDFNIEMEADMAKDSSFYYKGAIISDVENAIVLNLDMNIIKQNILKIKEFSYDKLISSQGKRQTRLNMLKLNGGVDVLNNNDFVFHDLKVKTSHPTDARIFNLMFGKPNIKQGQFTSNLKLNGRLSNPNILGNFSIVEANIPFLDTTLKKISIIFKDKTIEISSFGEILGNDVNFKGTLKNKLTTPYYVVNADLYTKVLDLDYITNKLKSVQVNETNTFDSLDILDLENLIIKNMKLTADEVIMRNLSAKDVVANVSINEKQDFKINNFKFDAVKGSVSGNFSYNLKNSAMGLNLKADKINANDLSVALFNLKNQIYGDLTGDTRISCNGTDFESCMKTLNGTIQFNVKSGRMPKLGSLEYLLKAGNLVKGGITGLSVNSVIDILTPLKTGEFSDIYGTMTIKKGVADDIEIGTKGKDLSLFISGIYNFSTSDAEMEVLGILSKKISTMLGPIGNVSLNTLFNVVPGIDLAKDSKILDRINKIPGIELNEKSFRKFIAEIKGDINGDNYVTSFKWIN